MTEIFARTLLFGCVLMGMAMVGCARPAETTPQAQATTGSAPPASQKTLDQQIQEVQRSSDIPPAAKAQIIERLKREHAGGVSAAPGS